MTNATTNIQTSTDKIVIKDLNGKYYLFEVPSNTINTTDNNSWIFNNPVFIRRLNDQEYQSWLTSGGFNVVSSGTTTNPTTTISNGGNNGNNNGGNTGTAVSEPWALVVMATTVLFFTATKKLKNFFA